MPTYVSYCRKLLVQIPGVLYPGRMAGWLSLLPLDDHETAEDALQVLVLVLPDPLRGLRVPQAGRDLLHRLAIHHARLPRLLDGFQPVKNRRGDLDRTLEPLRYALPLLVGRP